MGSADLSVVAPAISEALVATALGIFVAIPSSAAFNMISYWTQILGQKFDRFTMILLNRMQLELISRYKKTEEFENSESIQEQPLSQFNHWKVELYLQNDLGA